MLAAPDFGQRQPFMAGGPVRPPPRPQWPKTAMAKHHNGQRLNFGLQENHPEL
jgi:hypothetical protein